MNGLAAAPVPTRPTASALSPIGVGRYLYLKRITEVAREVVDGKGLSEKASQAMAKDLQGKATAAQSEMTGMTRAEIGAAQRHEPSQAL